MIAVLWVVAAVLVVLAVIGPRRWYWWVRAPFHRDPAATESSDLGYGVGAIVNWGVAVVLVGAAIFFTVHRTPAYDTARMLAVARKAAAGIEADPVGTASRTEQFIAEQAPKGAVRVSDASDVSASTSGRTVTAFELTNIKDDEPVCLVVTATGPDIADASVTTTVTAGHCPGR